MYGILDTFFNLPAILVGIKNRVWEIGQKNRKLAPVYEIWCKIGLIDTDGNLTPDGKDIVQHGKDMAEYYVDVLPILLKTDTSEDIDGISPETYQKLRSGLAEYHKRFIAPYFWSALGYGTDQTGLMVDVCGGAGLYAASWIYGENAGKDNINLDRAKTRSAVVIDRPGVQTEVTTGSYQFWPVDVFSGLDVSTGMPITTWKKPLEGRAKVVLLSEILHCKSLAERAWLVDLARSLLREDGSIVVNERHPNSYFSWRMACLTSHGESLDRREIAELMVDSGFTLTHSWNNSHYHATRWKPA